MKAELLIPEKRTLEWVIYQEIRNRIISLVYKPGEMLFENVVAAEFEVSRTPVRQAFLRLSNDRLLQVLPQRGARVSMLSVAQVNEAQFVRESLEISAFRQVASIWDDGQEVYRQAGTDILSIIDQQKLAVDRNDCLSFTKLDEDYHNAVIRLSGNMTLLAIVNEMRAHLNRLRYVEIQEMRHDREAVGHHREILEAIRRNDVEATARQLEDHLKVLEAFRKTIFEKHKDLFSQA